MITELIFLPFVKLIDFIIGLIPNFQQVQTYNIAVGFYDLMSIGLYFFGSFLFVSLIVNVVFWSTIQMSWVVIEWIYKKIPGVS